MATQTHAEELRESARAAFAHFDADGSGAIDARELRGLVATLGGYLTDKELDVALSALDRNGNGVIEEDEFVAWWTTSSADLHGDGQVGEQERALDRVKLAGQDRFRVDVHLASWHGNAETVERLIRADQELVNLADTTEYEQSNTPLHYAAYQGHEKVCAILLGGGAKVNATNSLGCSPLFFAAQQSRKAVVQLLLEHGADLRIPEKQHKLTAVDVCTCDEILAVFQARSGGVPGVPQPPTVRRVEDCSLSVVWEAPAERHDQIAPVSGYKVRAVRASTNESTSQSSSPSTAVLVEAYPTECLLTGLDPDSEYTVQVAAFNLHGIGQFSSPGALIRTRPARPPPPTGVRGRCAETGGIELTWEAVAGNFSFIVQQCIDESAGIWKNVAQADGSQRSVEIPDLFVDQTYRFRVAIVCKGAGQSEFSSTVSVRTASETKTTPREPAIVNRKPRGEWNQAVPTTGGVVNKLQKLTLASDTKQSDRHCRQEKKVDTKRMPTASTNPKRRIQAEPKPGPQPTEAPIKLSDSSNTLGGRTAKPRPERRRQTGNDPEDQDEDEYVYYSDASDIEGMEDPH